VTGCLLEIRKILRALVRINIGDEIRGEVDDLLQLLGGHVEEISESARNTLEEPDVSHGCSELDVTHTLATHLRPCHLDAATLTNDTAEPHTLVLPAVALPVPGWTEDTLVKQTILLRLQGPVVDRFGFLDLAIRPGSDLV